MSSSSAELASRIEGQSPAKLVKDVEKISKSYVFDYNIEKEVLRMKKKAFVAAVSFIILLSGMLVAVGGEAMWNGEGDAGEYDANIDSEEDDVKAEMDVLESRENKLEIDGSKEEYESQDGYDPAESMDDTPTEEKEKWDRVQSLRSSDDSVEPVLVRTLDKCEDIVMEYKIPEPRFNEIEYQTLNGNPTQRLSIGNAELYSEAGKPEIPMIPARVVLPRDEVVDSVEVIPIEQETLPVRHQLSYGEQLQRISCDSPNELSTQPDESVYGSDEAYPLNSYELHETQYANGFAIAHIDIFPVAYRPLSGRLDYFSKFTLEIETVEDTEHDIGLRVDVERFERRHSSSVDNLGALETYTDGEIRGTYQNVVDRNETNTYVFITNEDVADDENVDPNVDDFIDHRKDEGYSSTMVTTEHIYENYEGRNNFYKVRNFIKDAYNNWDTEFVTLGGDTNIIPYKTVYAEFAGYTEDIPTDLPYQCLDGEEWDDDFYAEVMIGRISGENAEQISNQLYKIMEYESDLQSGDHLQTGLSVGEELDSDTYGKEAMLELETYFSENWSWEGLFDIDREWSKQEIIDLINEDSFSVVNHLGHSWIDYNMKLDNGDEYSLTNTNYMFLKTQGCWPGAFDSDCIAERFTTENEIGGMFAGVFNSRYGWYSPGNPTGGPSHQLHRSFWEAAWDLDMDYFSEYNEYSQRDHYTDYRWDVLSANYFGCSATPFRGKEYDLELSIEGEGSVDVEPDEVGYRHGTEVNLTAIADEHWCFVEWTGDHQGSDEQITIIMDEDKEITAHFEEHTYSLDVTVEGAGSIEIYPYKEEYEPETEVELTAIADEHWYFAEWTEDASGSEEQTTVVMDSDKSITAHFEEHTYSLDVTVEGAGSIEIYPYKEEYEPGTEVELKAMPDEGWYFEEWIGDHEGTEEQLTVAMEYDKELTACFEIKTYALGIEIEGEGTVIVNPEQDEYEYGTEVELKAMPDEGWYFEEWMDTDETEKEITVTMNEDKNIILQLIERAYFEAEIISPRDHGEFEEGEKVTIEYNVTNIGGIKDNSQNIVFRVYGEDGEEVHNETVEVILEPREEYIGEFTWETEEAGVYELEVTSDESDSVTINIDDDQTILYDYWWLIPLIVMAAVIAIVVGVVWSRNKTSRQFSQHKQGPPPYQGGLSQQPPQQQPPQQQPPQQQPPKPPLEGD